MHFSAIFASLLTFENYTMTV